MEDGLKMGKRFQRGEERAFDFFFNSLFNKLVQYAYKFVHDKDSANDVAQHTFIVVWGKRESLSHPNVIKDYLYTTARNRCLTLLHREKRNEERNDALNYYESMRLTPPEADSKIIRAEVRAITHDWIKRLPHGCKEIMELLYIEGLSATQAAQHLKVNVSTIKTQKARGLSIIKKITCGDYYKKRFPDEKRNQPVPICLSIPKPKPNPKLKPEREKQKFIPWKKKGRPKAEWDWEPNEQEERIYELFSLGAGKEDLIKQFEITANKLNTIISQQRQSEKIKELYSRKKKINSIARIVGITVRETVERINYLFKLNQNGQENIGSTQANTA